MVEDKGIMHFDDACSSTSNEEDSLLSARSSPNMTSPSSASALSATGSSLDEGVDMGIAEENGSEMCKRALFGSHSDKFHPRHSLVLSHENDQPIDLSMKKPKKNQSSTWVSPTECKPQPLLQTFRPYNRRESGELVIDEDAGQSSTSEISNNNAEKAKIVEATKLDNARVSVPDAPVSQCTPTYLPWSYVPPPTSMPFASSALSPFWHPALLMSQAARHLAPGMGALPAVNFSPATGAPGFMAAPPTNRALNQIYDQNVLAEFSRICSQAQLMYGNHVLPDGAPTYNVTAGARKSPTVVAAVPDRRTSLSTYENKYGSEKVVVVKQEPQYPGEEFSRKRKYDDSQSSSSPRDSISPKSNDWQVSPPVGKRIREEYHRGVFDRYGSNESLPTMVQAPYNNLPSPTPPSTDANRIVPKPVDFKPCRFPCNECGRTYATVGGLMKHAKTHHDPENASNFKCKTCEKEYNSLGALKMHIRTHTLPCKCHICGKAFSRTWLLQGHIRTHTGEKPYQCSVCSRAFADRSNLRAHMQTHESVKRYACTSCDKTFSRISLLNRHHVSGCIGSPSSPTAAQQIGAVEQSESRRNQIEHTSCHHNEHIITA